MQIEEIIKNKSVLMIPVYSSRSYESGVYDMMSDGNTLKYLMKILKSEAKEIDIFYPRNSMKINDIIKVTNKHVKCEVNWLPRNYGKNAHETRNMGQYFFDCIIGQNKQYDIIISEVNTLAELAIKSNHKRCNKNNFIYWVGTHNTDGTLWCDGDYSLNKSIAQEITTACLLKGQPDLYGGKSFYDEYIYDPQYFDKKIIFFPFRLSDKSYHAEEFKEIIKEIKEEGYDNFVVLFTDVNDSHLFDKELANEFIQVPKNKFVYQAILKGKPIIPFLDSVEKNSHSNIFEFTYYGCDVIMLKNNVFKNVTQIENISELKNAIIKKLGGQNE